MLRGNKNEIVCLKVQLRHYLQQHIMKRRDVDTFVAATLALYHDPGINPHTGRKCSPVEKITLCVLKKSGRYWWTTPDLQNNNDPNGAEIWDWYPEKILWKLGNEEKIASRLAKED